MGIFDVYPLPFTLGSPIKPALTEVHMVVADPHLPPLSVTTRGFLSSIHICPHAEAGEVFPSLQRMQRVASFTPDPASVIPPWLFSLGQG